MHFITSFEAQLRDICIPKNIFPKLANINERQTHNLEIFKRGKRDDEGEERRGGRRSFASNLARELWIFQRREYCKLSWRVANLFDPLVEKVKREEKIVGACSHACESRWRGLKHGGSVRDLTRWRYFSPLHGSDTCATTLARHRHNALNLEVQ